MYIVICADSELLISLRALLFLNQYFVKIGLFHLTLNDKMGYNIYMIRNILSLILRISLVATLWAFVWRLVEPKTQLMRILRAALLVLGLLAILVAIRLVSQ